MEIKVAKVVPYYASIDSGWYARIVFRDGSIWHSNTVKTKWRARGVLQRKLTRLRQDQERYLFGSRK